MAGKKKNLKKGRRKEKKVIKNEGSKTSVVYIYPFQYFRKKGKRETWLRERKKKGERDI